MRSRWTFANALPGTIIPPFEPRAKAVRARSISPASRTLIGFTSTPSDGAAVWMAPNWPIPAAAPGSRRTAARVTPGAICLSSSSHFALRPYSKFVNPVALPPGRARLSTKPLPTGSTTCTNTIGTARVVCSNGAMLILPVARMTSGVSANNSSAYLRISSEFPAAGQRVSMRTLRPSVQPSCCSPCWKAAMRACPCALFATAPMSTPTFRMRSGCCARATSGHVATAPPSTAMTSRRFIRSPRRRGRAASGALQGRAPSRS